MQKIKKTLQCPGTKLYLKHKLAKKITKGKLSNLFILKISNLNSELSNRQESTKKWSV